VYEFAEYALSDFMSFISDHDLHFFILEDALCRVDLFGGGSLAPDRFK